MKRPVQLLHPLLHTNRHFACLILFFVLHGYSENQPLVPFVELALLFAELILAGIIVYWISKKIFRTKRKAGIFTTGMLFIVLFFGALQDLVARWPPVALFAALRYFVPFTLLVMILFFIWIKKTGKPFDRTIVFINALLLLFILVDTGSILYRFVFPESGKNMLVLDEKHQLVVCDTCNKPPVYLIIMDEYFGSHGLKEYFNYDNSAFENFLQQQGFHINKNTASNYQYTVFSTASLLNMNFIENAGPENAQNHFGYKTAISAIRNNRVCGFFEKLGYRIFNYSDFDIKNYPAGYTPEQPVRVRLITNQTMFYRVAKHLPRALARNGLIPWFAEQEENEVVEKNEEKLKKALQNNLWENERPAFIYLHLIMPHEPYAYDSSGNRIFSSWKKGVDNGKESNEAYLQYLVYTNKKITSFITRLQLQTRGRAVILLMSDHGYRHTIYNNAKFGYLNFNAVYLPSGQYDGWYDGMTNINQFRVLFNTLFHQQLPVLKDSLAK